MTKASVYPNAVAQLPVDQLEIARKARDQRGSWGSAAAERAYRPNSLV